MTVELLYISGVLIPFLISEKLVRLYLNCPTLLPERTEAGELKTQPRIWKYFRKIHTEIGKAEKSRLV